VRRTFCSASHLCPAHRIPPYQDNVNKLRRKRITTCACSIPGASTIDDVCLGCLNLIVVAQEARRPLSSRRKAPTRVSPTLWRRPVRGYDRGARRGLPRPLVVKRGVRLIGRDWPVIDGGGHGTVLKLAAPGITLEGFVIRGSGDSLEQENSGVAVEAPSVVVATIASKRPSSYLLEQGLRQRGAGQRDPQQAPLPPAPGRCPARLYSDDVLIEGT